jgi:hypothetical protein
VNNEWERTRKRPRHWHQNLQKISIKDRKILRKTNHKGLEATGLFTSNTGRYKTAEENLQKSKNIKLKFLT